MDPRVKPAGDAAACGGT